MLKGLSSIGPPSMWLQLWCLVLCTWMYLTGILLVQKWHMDKWHLVPLSSASVLKQLPDWRHLCLQESAHFLVWAGYVLLCFCISSRAVPNYFLTLRSWVNYSPGAQSGLLAGFVTEGVIRTNCFRSLLDCMGHLWVFGTEAVGPVKEKMLKL